MSFKAFILGFHRIVYSFYFCSAFSFFCLGIFSFGKSYSTLSVFIDYRFWGFMINRFEMCD